MLSLVGLISVSTDKLFLSDLSVCNSVEDVALWCADFIDQLTPEFRNNCGNRNSQKL